MTLARAETGVSGILALHECALVAVNRSPTTESLGKMTQGVRGLWNKLPGAVRLASLINLKVVPVC